MSSHVTTAARLMIAVLVVAAGAAAAAGAQSADTQPPRTRQSLSDAWWTGPMLANSAAMLPRGHFLAEPYLYDVGTRGTFDGGGSRHRTAPSYSVGSLTYLIYGLTNRVAIGLAPTAGYNAVHHGRRSSGVGLGDASFLVQYGLTRFREGSAIPATALSLQETFPTGKYDHLGERLGDGLGSGAYSTTLAFYSQTYFWLPNGRIFRMRFDASQAFSSGVRVEDASVYGTDTGFRGHAAPGSVSFLDLASEYSVTRRWVLALDVTYRHARNTQVTGYTTLDPASIQSSRSVALSSGPSDAFDLAPAVEYSWRSTVGVLVGVRLVAAGRNTAATVTPAVAINIVH